MGEYEEFKILVETFANDLRDLFEKHPGYRGWIGSNDMLWVPPDGSDDKNVHVRISRRHWGRKETNRKAKRRAKQQRAKAQEIQDE